jgi:nitrogen PTS system EIIA component
MGIWGPANPLCADSEILTASQILLSVGLAGSLANPTFRIVQIPMNRLADLVYPATVRAQVAVDSKRAFFPFAGSLAATALGLDASEVTEALLERERLGSTAFGRGMAIPHARIPGLSGVRGMFIQLVRPVEFDAIDSLPVDLVFVLLSPVDAGADHLKALAQVSRFLRDDAAVARLRGTRTSEAIYAILAGEEARDAA